MPDKLDLRIRQMHAALNAISSDELEGIRAEIGVVDGGVYAELDFNKDSDEAELANQADLLIQNIASIKDHLKVWCKKYGANFGGDDLIDSNRAVALVHDLWNTSKHGELNRPPRSGITVTVH